MPSVNIAGDDRPPKVARDETPREGVPRQLSTLVGVIMFKVTFSGRLVPKPLVIFTLQGIRGLDWVLEVQKPSFCSDSIRSSVRWRQLRATSASLSPAVGAAFSSSAQGVLFGEELSTWRGPNAGPLGELQRSFKACMGKMAAAASPLMSVATPSEVTHCSRERLWDQPARVNVRPLALGGQTLELDDCVCSTLVTLELVI